MTGQSFEERAGMTREQLRSEVDRRRRQELADGKRRERADLERLGREFRALGYEAFVGGRR